MRIERTLSGRVEVWLEDADEEDADEEEDDEPAADLSFTVEQMNALVVEWLRGPMGPPGATGAHG